MITIISPFSDDPSITSETLFSFAVMTVIFIISLVTAMYVGRFSAVKFNCNKTKTVWFFVGITGVVTLALLCFFGTAATAVKGIIFCLVLTFCSFCDIKSRECDDYPHLMTVIAAFIGFEISALQQMLLSALAVFGIMLLSMRMKATVNGADLKLATACTFFLGFQKGITGLLLGLTAAVVVNLIKRNKKGFPLIPYLAVGYMTAYFI